MLNQSNIRWSILIFITYIFFRCELQFIFPTACGGANYKLPFFMRRDIRPTTVYIHQPFCYLIRALSYIMVIIMRIPFWSVDDNINSIGGPVRRYLFHVRLILCARALMNGSNDDNNNNTSTIICDTICEKTNPVITSLYGLGFIVHSSYDNYL